MKAMNKRSILALALTMSAAIGTLATTGCFGVGSDAGGSEPAANEVFMRAIAFDPAEITIQVGESVTWTNRDILPHTATSGNPGDEDLGTVFRSTLLFQGGTFTHTFNEAGEFIYFCEVHRGLMDKAKVIVEGQDSQ